MKTFESFNNDMYDSLKEHCKELQLKYDDVFQKSKELDNYKQVLKSQIVEAEKNPKIKHYYDKYPDIIYRIGKKEKIPYIEDGLMRRLLHAMSLQNSVYDMKKRLSGISNEYTVAVERSSELLNDIKECEDSIRANSKIELFKDGDMRRKNKWDDY